MNKEKQHLVDLQSKIDQKSKELKQLRKEYETYFSAICKSWREQTNTMFPNLQPCNIGEYVGVDIIYEGKIYNLFITKEKQKLICMFSHNRKDRSTYDLTLKDSGKKLVDKLNAIFTEYPAYKSSCAYVGHGFYKNFKKEDYNEAFEFFLKVINSFTQLIHKLDHRMNNDKINIGYYLPLLQEYCRQTMSLYDNHYHQGPFIPYTMSKYKDAPLKIMYVGRDTLSWEPVETLKKAYQENKLEDYLIANTKCVDVEKMLEWKNNTGSFWNFVDKLHLLIRTGQMVTDINSVSKQQRDILEEIGYGNLHSIELIETLRYRFGEPEMPVTQEYLTICKAAKPFESLKSMIEAYHPDYVFVLSWIEKNDFFDGTDFEWQENMYRDRDKKYRAVYLSKKYKTKVVWTLHPNAMWRKGLTKDETQDLMEFLANTYRMLESKYK